MLLHTKLSSILKYIFCASLVVALGVFAIRPAAYAAPGNEQLKESVRRILQEEMEHVVHYSVPLTTEVGTGKTWLEAH